MIEWHDDLLWSRNVWQIGGKMAWDYGWKIGGGCIVG